MFCSEYGYRRLEKLFAGACWLLAVIMEQVAIFRGLGKTDFYNNKSKGNHILETFATFAKKQNSMINKWKLEDDVNDFVKKSLESLGLKKLTDYNVESGMSEYMKEALKGSSKTKNKTNFGKPDFHIEKYNIPVVFEDKLGLSRLVSKSKDTIKEDPKAVQSYAVNGALYYATQMIASEKYKEAVAIGIAGESADDVEISVFYVFGSSFKSVKPMKGYTTLDFLESKDSFNNFYQDAILTEADKHAILIRSKQELSNYARHLNLLMQDHNVTAPQRVLYVSGMLLSMQDIRDSYGNKIKDGLTPDDLRGTQTENSRDGKIIVNQIEEYLTAKNIPQDKRKLMLASFAEISKDRQRDMPAELKKQAASLIKQQASCNKQIFTYIYEYIYRQIDSIAGHIDIMGEMYSEFLKYAFGDGKDLGIVLTPPYVTKLMAELLDIDADSKVMDLATGSAGFLISSMELMKSKAERQYGKGTTAANEKIDKIKKEQLFGVELNAEMFTLASTNMILRGDGSSQIHKANTFDTPKELYDSFCADRFLLNPPFKYKEHGMPFFEFGLDRMEKDGLAAVIIQDSAGSGQGITTNKRILKKHTMLASIKMPGDLFQPMAGVQTSIYVFRTGHAHDFGKTVKFIDFRNDGLKRGTRATRETDRSTERYSALKQIFKNGLNAQTAPGLWELKDIYVEDFITKEGNDWNFEQHAKIDTTPNAGDFAAMEKEYLSWKVGRALKQKANPENEPTPVMPGHTVKKSIGDLFDIHPTKAYDLTNIHLFDVDGTIPVVTNSSTNNGISGYSCLEPTEEGNMITFSDTTTSEGIFYQPDPFVGYPHVQGLYPKQDHDKWNERTLTYFLVLFRKCAFGRFDYAAKFTRKIAAEMEVSLPATADGKIDFDFMAQRVRELEAQRVRELEAYLETTGLKQTDL